ncbi:benenodin family lasso peptide [Sphingomonas suaedae]|uniref:Benenodin family lasso peptide n=1 Tax=Sphingomonas suaedae TaxID=2599297 RepID=A0A518RCL9_9SPHN|nr:benenodin family lasso peptide [Sphingomonas suaedae]QDX25159.1 benenodin family lasso peptide [Sphingomonas suaedae]
MERENDVIELGTASIETKGPRGPEPDIGLGQVFAGLTDD